MDTQQTPLKPRRGVGFYIRVGIIPLLTLLALAHIAVAGTWEDGYREYVMNDADPQPYPIRGVATCAGFALLDAVILMVILRPWSFSYSSKRAGVALVNAAAWSGYVAMSAMHAPPYVGAFLIWVWLATLILFILFIVSVAGSLWRTWKT